MEAMPEAVSLKFFCSETEARISLWNLSSWNFFVEDHQGEIMKLKDKFIRLRREGFMKEFVEFLTTQLLVSYWNHLMFLYEAYLQQEKFLVKW